MAMTKDGTIRSATKDYLSTYTGGKEPDEIAEEILMITKNYFDMYNAAAAKNAKWKIPDRLLPIQLAEIMVTLHPIVAVETAGANCDKDFTLVALYQEDGVDEGIYVTSDEVFSDLVNKYCYGINEREFKDLMWHIKRMAPRVKRCMEPNLIAVNNGIFDFDTKTLLPFSKDYVFLSKSRVNYNPNAQNVVIHNPIDNTDWDIESWMDTLTDDKAVSNVLWQVLGAVIRPNVPWGVSAWFYSEKGNNGKGTLCELMRELVGEGSYASIPLADMGKDFMLEPLTRATSVIVDENDVGTYIDKAANLKAIVTGDTVMINRKFKVPIPYQFHGFMVQCLNEMPRVRDKSDSFFRRQLFIPFTKCFTGAERKYIKQDYLHRKEVLEYVMFRVLNMNYYEFDVPEVCKTALEEYKEFNDPVRQFMADIMPELQWDLVPFTFLYDLYGAWYKKNVSTKDIKSSRMFKKDLLNLLPEYPDWYCSDDRATIKPAGKMDKPEWLIDEYKLEDWYNPTYKGNDKSKKCCPALKSVYRGIQRV